MNMYRRISEIRASLPANVKISWKNPVYASTRYVLYDMEDTLILVGSSEKNKQLLIPIDDIKCITII